jgi:hypothetical protein
MAELDVEPEGHLVGEQTALDGENQAVRVARVGFDQAGQLVGVECGGRHPIP